MRFDAVRLIEAKRDGGELREEDVLALVAAYLADEVSDAQMAALFMAGMLQGFSDAEAIALTKAYVASGDVVDLGALHGPTVDKHSTGGVGDTTTFVVGPIVAACGLQLAKLSGRGLGHTGGTLDKLESIPGVRVGLSAEELTAQVNRLGLAVAAATAELAPADKRTYALRDVTGTVGSQALIAASIMSKKIAGGARNLILDVKTGGGAFLADAADAASLARLCMRIGTSHGLEVRALITDMSQPLGPAIGNALEIKAAIDVLKGQAGSLREVSLALASGLLAMTGVAQPEAVAKKALDSGDALERFAAMVAAQGGPASVVEAPGEVLPVAPVSTPVVAGRSGMVTAMDCRMLGQISVRLGAGRLGAHDVIDPAVGIVMDVRVGDRVDVGQRLAVVHARDDASAANAVAEVTTAVVLGEAAAAVPSVLGVFGG